jgi:Holliday junction resolvase
LILDNDRIEQLATTAAKMELLKDECLAPFISEQEKGPSWDGHIYIYRSNKKSKDNIYRRVPVQVKGKEVKRFGGKTKSFQCDIPDLVNWSNEGGAFLFVVEVKEDTTSKIYYADLLTTDINNLLEKTLKSQTTKNVIVKELKPRRLKFLLLNFAENKDKQVGRTPIPIEKINQLYEINFEVKTDKSDNFDPIELVDTDIVIYERFNLQDQFAPLAKRFHISSFVKPLNRKVQINRKTYYDEYQVETTKDTESLIFSRSTKIDLGKEKSQIHFCIKGNIYESQKDCQFIVDFLTAETDLYPICWRAKSSVK